MNLPEPGARDLVRRFIFENRPVRGHWVRLDAAWREVCAHAHYTPAVTALLGEAVVASVLLASTLKFRGTLTLQLQGDGAVSLLVAQCTHDFRVRAVARCEPAASARPAGEHPGAGGSFRELVGAHGRVAVTIEAEERSSRYQGVVPLGGESLAECLEAYFASSEQLPTRVLLAADAHLGAGLLVQKLPQETHADPEEGADAWDEARAGMTRVSREHLLADDAESLLARGFAAHDLRLFQGSPVRFECRCSPGRVAGLLRALGAGEVRDVLREQGAVTVTCEFCHRPYRFDAIDVESLFAHPAAPGGSGQVH